MAETKVMRSIEEPGGLRCVDLFRRPDGSWGFAEYRRNPEDPRGWTGIGAGTDGFASLAAALDAARGAVPWLDAVPGAAGDAS